MSSPKLERLVKSLSRYIVKNNLKQSNNKFFKDLQEAVMYETLKPYFDKVSANKMTMQTVIKTFRLSPKTYYKYLEVYKTTTEK